MGGLFNEPIADPRVPETEGSQIGDHRLAKFNIILKIIVVGRTSCGVFERPDNHCGDGLVFVQWRPMQICNR